jgi:hypothetical protein
MLLIIFVLSVIFSIILAIIANFKNSPQFTGGSTIDKIENRKLLYSRKNKEIMSKIDEHSFPYVYKTLNAPEVMFKRLCESKLSVRNDIIFRTYPEEYYSSDRVADHYTEELRMRAVFLPGRKVSPYDYWLSHKNANYEEIYQKSGVANGFNPAIARYLCEKFGAKSVFDPCMGWGDRLIGCMAAGVKKYVGYDTNTKLEEKYVEISKLAPIDVEFNMRPIEVGPFEYSGFDLVITSPPFFTIEIYEGEFTSTTLYKTEKEWYNTFYRLLIDRCVKAVKSGGHLCFYIAPQMLEYSKKFMTEFGATYVGAVGFYQDAEKVFDQNKIRNTYIWRV